MQNRKTVLYFIYYFDYEEYFQNNAKHKINNSIHHIIRKSNKKNKASELLNENY